MTIYGFDDPWYAGIIDRFAPQTDHATDEVRSIDNLSTCILAAACIVAQSIDNLAKSINQHGGNHA